MKNITVSVDEETHRLARIRAAELDTSVSALVRDYRNALVGEPAPQDSASGDGAILAAARALRCEAVYSEDLSHWQDYGGIRVFNPFREADG